MNLKYSNSNSYPQNPNTPLPDSVAFNPVLLTISPRHGAIQTSQRDRTPPGFNPSSLQTDRPRKRIFDAPKQANLGNISQDIISGNSFTRSPKKEHNRTTTNISNQYQNNISVENAPDRPKHPILGPQAQHTRYIAGYRDISPEPQPKTVNMNKPTLSISPNKQQMPQQSNIRGSVFESFAQDGYFVPSHNYSDSTSTKLTSPSGSSVVDSMKGSVGMFGSVANPFVHQPQSFYVDGATHPDLDTSCTSSALSQTSRRRMKPIVVMNINIGNGKKEEIRVHEGDDPLELANTFCKSYKLPKTLVQVLGNNIMSQVNNYYALKAQKTTRKLSDNYQQFSEPAQPPLHSQIMNQNYNNTVENDPRMSEKVAHNRPLPHSLPQNPALEDSSCQNQVDPRGNETNRSRNRNYPEYGHHRVQTSPGRYTEDDEFDFVKGSSRRYEVQKTEGDFEEYEKSDHGEIAENEKENDDSGSDTDKARLEELEEQIKKLQQKKEKYLAKVQKPELKTKQNKSMVVSKSSNKDIQNKEVQPSRAGQKRGALVSPLSSIPEGRGVNANKPLSTRNIHGRENVFESENKQQNKVRKSPVRAQAQARIDTGIRNTNKGVLTPRQLQNTNEYERDYSPQNTRLTPKSPLKSPLTKDTRKTTPKNAASTQMKPYPELKTGSMLLPENKMSLKSNEDDESRVQRKGYNQSVKVDYKASELNQSRYQTEEDELKMQVLTDIFKSLDDDFDGNISSEHVDISSFDDKILDSMSEILEALEAGMVLTFKDFCNIVNQRKLLDALKKKYSTGPVHLGTPERNKSNNYEAAEKPFLSPKDSAPSHDSPSTAHDSKADGESSLSLRSTFKDTLKAPSLDSYGEVDLSNRYLQVTDKNFGKKTFV